MTGLYQNLNFVRNLKKILLEIKKMKETDSLLKMHLLKMLRKKMIIIVMIQKRL